MSTLSSTSVWLNDTDVCHIEQLSAASGLSLDEIEDLIEAGVIEPVDPTTQPRAFRLVVVTRVKTARRLRDDFELDRSGVALALSLLRRIDELQAQLTAVQAGAVPLRRR